MSFAAPVVLPSPRPARHARLAALALAVLVLHGAVVLGLRPAAIEVGLAARRAVPALQTRSLVHAARGESGVPPATPAATQAPPAAPPETVARSARHGVVEPQALRPRPRVAPAETPVPMEATAAAAPTSTAAAAALPPAFIAGSELPVYATRLPPPGRWTYRMQRGAASGQAELSFVLDGDSASSYAIQLEARVDGVSVIDWASRGQLDAAGLAPDRFALRRRGRDRQAANFRREAGTISFSGPTHVQPLLAGAQDRLSWLLQLPAIVAAAPERFVPGANVVLFVAGARGDADLWTFVVEGAVRSGETDTLKLVREPRRLYDTRAEIWLDPARDYLPQRLLQTPSGGGAALDLVYEPGLR